MSDKFTEYLIDPARIRPTISTETRAKMARMLEFADPSPAAVTTLPLPTALREKSSLQKASPAPSQGSSQISSCIASLIPLMSRILNELETNMARLLTLNPSRREAIVQHLERLAGLHTSQQKRTLQDWIAGSKTDSQIKAIQSYFEEVALIALGQAILLKSWSDQGVRKWTEGDLGRLNWALSTALKPHVPLDREGWQITRPNLYSWYNPHALLQSEIWNALETWKIPQESPQFISQILTSLRKSQPENFEPHGYDSRFFSTLWESIRSFGFNPTPELGPLKRSKIIFSPTLRDCSMVRTGPQGVNWVGLEASPFQLMMGELMQIWWGPTPPPHWAIGSGLEVHTRDQLALALGSTKASAISRITEMEACDLAVVLEEQVIRAQGRNANAARFRELLDALPYFKKIRSAGTSLGDLQACVALSKLRPGGLLWWAREEPLSPKDGIETLHFLLDRAKLCFEWNLSELEHSLPLGTQLYPNYIYLFQKEIDVENRLSHRPIQHSIQGQIRSYIELPLVLEDALQSAIQPIQPRGQWLISSHPSPTSQREWLEKWPDPLSQSTLRQMNELRLASFPLARFATIRPTPEGDSSNQGQWAVHPSLKGFWISSEYDAEGRKLICRSLPRCGSEAAGSGFLVLIADESWIPALSAYLMSEQVRQWLDHNAERRGDRWILNEQVIKWIPAPKSLLKTLGICAEDSEGSFSQQTPQPLPPEWERLIEEVSFQPQVVREALAQVRRDDSGLRLHAEVFVKAALAIDQLRSWQGKLFSLVSKDGKIHWKDLLDILPPNECTSIAMHPRVRLTGSLPPHLAIEKIERVKTPSPGILLSTASGFSLMVSSDSFFLLNILWDQLDGIQHPTWNELTQYLRLPRKLELAESTALDVLRSHGEQIAKLKELQELLNNCQFF